MNETMFLCYAFLSSFTILIPLMAVLNWRRVGGPEQLLIPALLYYYSLYGAWTVLSVKRGSLASDALDHLEASLVTVNIDGNYLLTICLYGLFVSLVVLGIGIRRDGLHASTASGMPAIDGAPSVGRLISLALVALALSAVTLWAEILSAIDQGVPIYILTRTEASRWFTVHQLLNRVGLAAIAAAWPVLLLQGQRARHVRASGVVLGGLTLVWLVFLGALGDRNAVVVATVGGFYFYRMLGGRIQWKRALLLAGVAFMVLRTIEYLRANPAADMLGTLAEAVTTARFWNPLALARGSESLAAHLSLYGIIEKHLPLTWGESLVYLAQSLVPFIPSGDRVQDSYQTYAHLVGAPASQGFNIHFAAGAYLNAGIPGLMVAAGIVVVLFHAARLTSARMAMRTRLQYPGLFAYAIFCSLLPIGMRAGPEGIKALVFEGFLLPMLVIAICVRRARPVESPSLIHRVH